MQRILVVGPSPDKSKGGMATVIKDILNDKGLNAKFNIVGYSSYIDGNKIKVAMYSVFTYLKFLAKCQNYDVYHVHMASNGSTYRKSLYINNALKRKKKVIIHVHGGGFIDFFDGLTEHKKKQISKMLNAADCVVALSEDWKRVYIERFGLKNCVVIENGIDLNLYQNAMCDSNECNKSFLVLGRMIQTKGTYDLLEAVKVAKAKVPDITVYMAGDGEIEKVKETVAEYKLQDNVKVVGWADQDKKMELLRKCSTVVLPSYHEALPMSILEGMAAGKAIISTYVGAIPEVVGEENGILINPGDVEALADALVRCATDLEMVSSMGKANLEKIQNEFSMTVMHEKLAKYYNQLGV